jgi:hemoglobin
MPYRRLVPLCERIGREGIEAVVRALYDRLAADPVIGHHFARIQDHEAHLRRVCDFWFLSLGGRLERPPQFDMVARHRPLRLSHAEVDVWLGHFHAVTAAQLEPGAATEWQRLAHGIAARLRAEVVAG